MKKGLVIVITIVTLSVITLLLGTTQIDNSAAAPPIFTPFTGEMSSVATARIGTTCGQSGEQLELRHGGCLRGRNSDGRR